VLGTMEGLNKPGRSRKKWQEWNNMDIYSAYRHWTRDQ